MTSSLKAGKGYFSQILKSFSQYLMQCWTEKTVRSSFPLTDITRRTWTRTSRSHELRAEIIHCLSYFCNAHTPDTEVPQQTEVLQKGKVKRVGLTLLPLSCFKVDDSESNDISRHLIDNLQVKLLSIAALLKPLNLGFRIKNMCLWVSLRGCYCLKYRKDFVSLFHFKIVLNT